MRFATLFDAKAVTEEDRLIAENAYEAAITAIVNDKNVLKAIYEDNLAGLNDGVDRFEKTKSAWSELDRIGCIAAEKAIGYWPGDAAHFEVNF